MERLAVAAMGTRFEVVLPAVDGAPQRPALRAAGEAALEEIDYWHRRLNRFAPDSFLAHVVRTPAVPVRLDRDTWDLFADALTVWRASAGVFDVTLRSAGVGSSDCRLRLDASSLTIATEGPGVAIDLGGIAKGHALDCAAARLRDAGVTAALLHGGTSSVLAIGRPREAAGWRVALGRDGAGSTLMLADTALSLSDPASQRAALGRDHIVDPRAGEASTTVTGRRVVVTGPSARLADAWSTALAVLGRVPAAFPADYQARFLPLSPLEPAHDDPVH